MMTDMFYIDEALIRKEKARARELRKTGWWKKKIASGICCYCGKRFSPDKLTMDHVVPLSRGGEEYQKQSRDSMQGV